MKSSCLYLLFIIILISSCNVMEAINGPAVIDQEFFQNNKDHKNVSFQHGTNFNFGNIISGNDATNLITLRNGSKETIEILGGVLNGADFDYAATSIFPGDAGDCGNSLLLPTQSCLIELTISTSSIAYYQGNLEIEYKKEGDSDSYFLQTGLSGAGVDRILQQGGAVPFSFGDIVLTSTPTQNITVDYSGSGSATLGQITIPSKFSFVGGSYPGSGGTCNDPLSATCILDITLDTSSLGQFNQEVSVKYDNGLYEDELFIELQATVKTPALITSDIVNHSFGDVAQGGSDSIVVTFTNAGGIAANSILLDGEAAPFSRITSCSTSLAPQSTCTATITFAPAGVGAFADIINFNYNDGLIAKLLAVNIDGDGKTAASLAISESDPYDYGTVIVSGGVASHPFTITNGGGMPATSFAINGLSSPYSVVSTDCGSSLAAAGSCNLTVQFMPSVPGTFNDTINIDYNNGVTAVAATRDVTGTGVQPAILSVVSGSSYDFGTTTPSVFNTLTIQNSGGSTATSLSTFFTIGTFFQYSGGTYPGIGGTCGPSLGTGGNCTIVLEYAPTANGVNNDSLSIDYDDGLMIQNYMLNLTGTGSGF